MISQLIGLRRSYITLSTIKTPTTMSTLRAIARAGESILGMPTLLIRGRRARSSQGAKP